MSRSASAVLREYLAFDGDTGQMLAPGRGRSAFDPVQLLSLAPRSTSYAELVGGLGIATAILGCCLALARFARLLIVPLTVLGSMPLTVYVLQTLTMTFLPQTPLSHWYGQALSDGTAFATIFLGSIAATFIWWLAVSRRGPLETVTAAAVSRFTRPTQKTEA